MKKTISGVCGSCAALLALDLLSAVGPVYAAEPPKGDTAKTKPTNMDEHDTGTPMCPNVSVRPIADGRDS